MEKPIVTLSEIFKEQSEKTLTLSEDPAKFKITTKGYAIGRHTAHLINQFLSKEINHIDFLAGVIDLEGKFPKINPLSFGEVYSKLASPSFKTRRIQ